MTHPRRESFGPDEIVIPPRIRDGINEESVVALMSSISRIGLRTPITVRWERGDGDPTVILVAGRHRLEASRRLGVQLIDCLVFDGDEADARLWEIAENLHRADLSKLERAEHIAEWVRLTEEKQSLAQLAPVTSRRADGRGGSVGSGINAAVRDLGIDRTEAQRAVKVAALSEETKQAARDAGLDRNQSALLEAARAPAADSTRVIQEIAERKVVKPAPAPLNDLETEEQWRGSMMRLWNRAPNEWRENFIEYVQSPVFDSTRAA